MIIKIGFTVELLSLAVFMATLLWEDAEDVDHAVIKKVWDISLASLIVSFNITTVCIVWGVI